MFFFLVNILCWAILIAVLFGLYKNKVISDKTLSFLGWIFLGALLILAFSNITVADQPVFRTFFSLLFFPTTILGFIITILFFNWRKIVIKKFKLRSGESKYIGEKFDNKDIEGNVRSASWWIGFALFLLIIASNNALSTVFMCYLVEQGDNSVEQAYRRDVRNLDATDLNQINNENFDLIVVMSGESPYKERFIDEVDAREKLKRLEGVEPSIALTGGQVREHLLEAARIRRRARQNNRVEPLILLSGGRSIESPNGFPCGIAKPNDTGRSRDDVTNEIADLRGGARGLRYDPRYDYLYKPNNTGESVRTTGITEADDMCFFLTQLTDVPKSAIILEPNGTNIRRSAEKIRDLESQKVLPTISERNKSRILLLTSPLETVRTFQTFKNLGLDVIARPVYTSDFEECKPSLRPWPLRPDPKSAPTKFRVDPEKILLSADAFVRSERAWKESLTIFLYWLRFWVLSPLTDERPYFPTSPPTPTTTVPPAPAATP